MQTSALRSRTPRGDPVIVTALALDPIEKKPLARFAPGSKVFSVGSLGCTMHCPWCQNHNIAQPSNPDDVACRTMTAQQLVAQAKEYVPYGNIGLAYTYNEPLLHWRDVLECAKLAHSCGLVNIMVTNGAASERVISELAPYVNAWNIDLKAATQEGYDVCGCRIEDVKRTIKIAHASQLEPAQMAIPYPGAGKQDWPKRPHVEVTTLVIPGFNDSDRDFEAIASWLASIDETIVWHLTRFFPQFHYDDRPVTPISTLERARDIGQHYLKTVLLGNV